MMLRDVVVEGTGKNAAVAGYTPAGKTGTSRKTQPGGGYVDAFGVTKYQSTFVGFVPAEQPALSIIVIMDEPGGGQYTGGAVAAPAWSKIASFALQHVGVPPPLTDAPAGGVVAASGRQRRRQGPRAAGRAGAASADPRHDGTDLDLFDDLDHPQEDCQDALRRCCSPPPSLASTVPMS